MDYAFSGGSRGVRTYCLIFSGPFSKLFIPRPYFSTSATGIDDQDNVEAEPLGGNLFLAEKMDYNIERGVTLHRLLLNL